jgi:hypothetical protein
MAMHWSRHHSDKWVNTLKESQEAAKLVHPEYDPGTQEPQRRKKGRSVLTEEQKVIRRKQQKDWYDKHKRKRANISNHLEEPRAFINCCPKCGEELTAYFLAAGAVARRKAMEHAK